MKSLFFKPQADRMMSKSPIGLPSLKRGKGLKRIGGVLEYKLSNGMEVVLCENQFASGVSGVVVVKAGAKHDPIGANGMAHLIEHLVFKGGEKIGAIDFEREKAHLRNIEILFKELHRVKNEKDMLFVKELISAESIKAAKYSNQNEYNDLLKRIGATDVNANTNFDRTIFHSVVPPAQLSNWLTINSQIFIRPVFRSLLQELEIIKEERRNSTQNQDNTIYDVVLANIFKTLPFGCNTIGGVLSPEHAPTVASLREFYARYYVPSNMALVLVGNFNSRQVKPLIESSFGAIPKQNFVADAWPKEIELDGREFRSERIATRDTCVVGFQTVSANHADAEAIDLIMLLLSDVNKIGLLDQLESNNKISDVRIIDFPFGEAGCLAVQASPVGFVQGLRGVERLILKQFEKIKKGQFDDRVFESLKQKMIFSYISTFEDHVSAAFTFADNISVGNSARHVATYVQRIQRLTKEEIVVVANKYFNANYFCLFAKKGQPVKEVCNVEDFKAIRPLLDRKSVFAKELEAKLAANQAISFPSFPDTQNMEVVRGVNLYTSYNPINDIFRLTMKFKIGESKMKGVSFVADLLNAWIKEEKTKGGLTDVFPQFSCNLLVYADADYFTFELTGFEFSLGKAICRTAVMLKWPDFSRKRLKNRLRVEKEVREHQIGDIESVVNAFHSLFTKGEKSMFKNRAFLKDLSKMDRADFEIKLSEILSADLDVFFSGKTSCSDLKDLLQREFCFQARKTDKPLVSSSQARRVVENKIYFLNNEYNNQVHIGFFAQLPALDIDLMPEIEGFNAYFSGDFSGLLLQEIRETYPLAYSASGYVSSAYNGKSAVFRGYVLTHAEKAIRAIQTYLSLLEDMPRRPERFQIVSQGIINRMATMSPRFREAPYMHRRWSNRGADIKVHTDLIRNIKQLQFSQIEKFYEKYIQRTGVAICITGNLNNFSMEELLQIGPVRMMNVKDLFTM